MNKPRVIKWLALVSGTFLVALFALLVLLPMMIDSDTVKVRARAFVAEKTNGLASFEKIELFWFPRPGVVFRDAAISFDKQIEGKMQQLTLYPSLRHLLTGRLAFSSVTADGATWIVRLPARHDEPFNLAVLEEKVRTAVKNLGLGFPAMNLRLRRGMADISFAGGPSLRIRDIDGNLAVTPERLALTMSGDANVAERIRFTGEVATGTLVSEARFSVENFRLRQVIDFFSPGSVGWLDDGAATLSVKLTARGLKSYSAEIAGSLPSLTLARGSRKALIAAKDFKVIFAGDEKVLRVAIEKFPLVSPPLRLAGELIFDRLSSAVSVKLSGQEFDIAMIRKSAVLLADNVAIVEKVFRYVQGGTVDEIHFAATGQSLAEALTSKLAVVSANLRGVKISVPGPDLDLENVAGSLLISAGVLECKKCAATLGKAKGRDGTLRVGLTGAGAPFHLDMKVETDARELQALLARHVKDDAIRKEVLRFHDVDGSVSGRLVLGETLDTIAVKVSAVPTGVTASYKPVPLPVSLTGGVLNYENGRIEAASLAGAIGRSSFTGLIGSMRADRTGQLNIKSASVQLDLAQIESVLRKVETIQAQLGPESTAQGKINFTTISLSGPLNDPSRWDFTGRGKVEGILIKHAQLPAAVAISQGTFDASRGKLTFADAKVELLDATLTASGVVENWRKAPLRIEATASGASGGKMMEWVRRRMEIPADYMLRSPLEFSASRVAWRDAGDFSINGKLTVAHGPRLSIDMARHLHRFTIKELMIDDGGQSARATVELDRDSWGVAFNGTLNQQMLDRIFLTAPVPIGLLQGHFAVNGFSKPPYRLSARGTLAGKNIVSRWKGEVAVIEQFVVQGDQAGLNIHSADLRWRRSHIALSGKLAPQQEALRVDMDVSADRIVWEELSGVFGTGDAQTTKANAAFQLSAPVGVIRLKADSFAIGGLFWNSLGGKVNLAPKGISGEIDNAVVCGIRTVGRFAVQNTGEIELDVKLSVQNGELESTSRCLSSEKSDVSGTYSIDAHLTGSGKRERLAQALSGGFDFVARDGKFIRSAAVDATFDYLNQTGDFKVAFPDLNREAFPYRLISGKGTVAGQKVIAEEIIIEASPYAITAQAKADLERKTIDAKGLVTVLLPADNIIKSIPLVGSMVSGSIVGIPVEVSGAFEQPKVSYLSPAALAAEIVNVPLRILKLPLGSLQIFTPSQPDLNKQ